MRHPETPRIVLALLDNTTCFGVQRLLVLSPGVGQSLPLAQHAAWSPTETPSGLAHPPAASDGPISQGTLGLHAAHQLCCFRTEDHSHLLGGARIIHGDLLHLAGGCQPWALSIPCNAKVRVAPAAGVDVVVVPCNQRGGRSPALFNGNDQRAWLPLKIRRNHRHMLFDGGCRWNGALTHNRHSKPTLRFGRSFGDRLKHWSCLTPWPGSNPSSAPRSPLCAPAASPGAAQRATADKGFRKSLRSMLACKAANSSLLKGLHTNASSAW